MHFWGPGRGGYQGVLWEMCNGKWAILKLRLGLGQ